MFEQALPSGSIFGALRDITLRAPDGVVTIDAGVESPHCLTRRELLAKTGRLVGDLRSRGIVAGDCIGVWLPNWSDSLVWQFAASALGAHVMGINTRYNVDELVHVLDLAKPRVVAIAHDFVKLDLLSRFRQAIQQTTVAAPSVAVIAGPHRAAPGPDVIAAYDAGAGAWTPSTSTEVGAEDDGTWNTFEDALAVAFSTSGSTGRPKLAAHTSRAVAVHAAAVAAAGDWQPGDVTLCALPLTGVFAFVPAMAAILSGGTCLLEPSFDPERIVADMGRYGVTHVIGADDIVAQLMEKWRAKPPAEAAWRRLLIADFNGRSLEVAQWAEDSLSVKVSGVYGSSELFALAALWPLGTESPRRWRGGGALVSPAMEVRCADPDSNETMAVGEAGELQFRGYNVVDDYLGAPGMRPTQLTADGWFRTGDLGVLHANDTFDFVCRMGDSLRLKGFLVEPAEIEARIGEFPAVELVKVVGLRLDSGQTEAVAFIQLRKGAAALPGAIQEWCAQGLARHKVPRTVHFVEAMPTTSGVNGTKIRTAELRQWAQESEAGLSAFTLSRN